MSDIEHPLDLVTQFAIERAARIKAEKRKPQRRIMVIGTSGSGKTYAASTSPKPVYIDYDHQLNDEDVINRLHAVYPMWDNDFVKNELKFTGTPLKILEDLITVHLRKLTLDYTAIFDSGSLFADKLKENLEARIPKGEDGGKDGYWYWREWAKAWRGLCEKIANLECNVIFIFHESEIRDESTGRLEKYGWMMQGKEFTPRIPQFFTDVVRQIHTTTTKTGGTLDKEIWQWQIKPTPEFPIAKSRCNTQSILIPATWQEIIK